MKEIEIDKKKYPIKCTAYTRFEYKKIFGTGIFEDIGKLNKYKTEVTDGKNKLLAEGKTEEEADKLTQEKMMEKLDDFIDVIQKIAYIEILTADRSIGTFEKWLSGIETISLGDKWISEVTEYAVDSFCGSGTRAGAEETTANE